MTTENRLLLPVAVAALAVLGLAGCAPGAGSAPKYAPSTTAPAAESGGSTGQSDDASTIPAIPEGAGVISATTMTGCDTSGAKVTARGTMTMPKDKKGDVVISVSWVDSTNSSVHTRGVTTIESPKPGEKKQWTITADLPEGSENVQCVLGAVIPK